MVHWFSIKHENPTRNGIKVYVRGMRRLLRSILLCAHEEDRRQNLVHFLACYSTIPEWLNFGILLPSHLDHQHRSIRPKRRFDFQDEVFEVIRLSILKSDERTILWCIPPFVRNSTRLCWPHIWLECVRILSSMSLSNHRVSSRPQQPTQFRQLEWRSLPLRTEICS